MNKTIKHYILGAAIAVMVIFSAKPVMAAPINPAENMIEINSWWAGSKWVTFDFSGIDWHDGSTVTGFHEYTPAGGFKTYNLTTDPLRNNSFQSWCVDIFSNFDFVMDSLDILKPANVALAGSSATSPTAFSSKAATDLGRLYTNHHGAVDLTSSTGTNEAAFQLAIWEIVNERSGSYYSLSSGDFTATSSSSSTISRANTWLNELDTIASISAYKADIWTVQSVVSVNKGYAQDLVVFSKVPEPETYALLLFGLGMMGFTMSRRKNIAA